MRKWFQHQRIWQSLLHKNVRARRDEQSRQIQQHKFEGDRSWIRILHARIKTSSLDAAAPVPADDN